jgi:hypothetical protein
MLRNPAREIVGSGWVCPTDLKNFFLNNNLSDIIKEWFNRKAVVKNIPFKKNSYPQHVQFLMNQGNKFENDILNTLKTKFPGDYIDIDGKARSKSDFEKTCESIKNKVPLIFGAVLHDFESKLFGKPDIIIREDYISKVFRNFDIEQVSNSHPSRKIGYVAIDVKFTTLMLSSDGVHLTNSGFIPCYKGQLEIYRRIINKISGKCCMYAILLGRGYTYTCKNEISSSNDPFERPGIYEPSKKFDAVYITKTMDAVKWIRHVRSLKTQTLEEYFEGETFRVPCAPNMSISGEQEYIHNIKVMINNVVCDITQLWNCGYKHRLLALKHGISGWNDPKFNAELIGFRGKNAKTINNIVQVNKPTNNLVMILPQTFEGEIPSKRVYIDFETLADISSDRAFSSQGIFMIGIYHDSTFKTFSTLDFSKKGENDVCQEFCEYIKQHNLSDHHFIHWSSAENWQWEKARRRLSHDTNLKLFDLCKFFQDNSITVNGCFNYSLKNIARCMKERHLINSSWDTSEGPSDGLNAIISLYNSPNKIFTLEQIAKYNYIDVKVLEEITNYIISH